MQIGMLTMVRNLLLALLFLPSFVFGQAAIFNGNAVQIQKPNLIIPESGSNGRSFTLAVPSLTATYTVTVPLDVCATGEAWVFSNGTGTAACVNVFTQSETIGVANGGTGLTATPTNGQLLIGNGTGYTLAGLTGTANQITVTTGAGSITLSTPQDIATTSDVTFDEIVGTTRVATPNLEATTSAGVLFEASNGTDVATFGASNSSQASFEGILESKTSLLLQDPGAGTNGWTIQSPTLGANYALTLPVDDGVSGQVLTTDGSGVSSWSSVITNPMTTKGDLITTSNGTNVVRQGIGTNGDVLTAASGETNGMKWSGTAKFLGSIEYDGAANCSWSTTTSGSWASYTADADCNTASASGLASAPGTKIPAITFSAIPAGRVVVTAVGYLGQTASNAGAVYFRFFDGTNGYDGSNGAANGATGAIILPTLRGEYTYGTNQGATTIEIQGSSSNGTAAASIQPNVSDFRNLLISVYWYPLGQ